MCNATLGFVSRRNVSAMERITARSDGDFYTVLYGSLWVAALSVIWFFCRADPEKAVKYAVEPPEQAKPGWKGEVLEKPALKVRFEPKCTSICELTVHRFPVPLSSNATLPQPDSPWVASTLPPRMASIAPLREQKLHKSNGRKRASCSAARCSKPC
jgi:hypothetical protein